MQDPKILKIARLKQTIQAFKKYDAERKKYMEKLQNELEDISERYCQLKSSIPKDMQEVVEQCQQKIANYKTTVKSLDKKVENLQKVISLTNNPEALAKAEEVLRNYTVVQLKADNDNLKKEVDRLRKNNDELVLQLIKLKNKIQTNE